METWNFLVRIITNYLTRRSCSRYKNSHPMILSRDRRLANPDFQFVSCSGAVAKQIVEDQIPKLNAKQDAILLSVGKFSHKSSDNLLKSFNVLLKHLR